METEILKTKTILALVDIGEFNAESSIDELEELAKTANCTVVAKIIQKLPSEIGATYLGEGKLEEIAKLCRQYEAELVIFDTELSGSQIRNIEKILSSYSENQDNQAVRVIDRTMLILDIFAGRAISGEGKLQVELAQLKYRLPRLSGLGVSMSRLGAGIGTRGPGETKLETDRRHIRQRISKLTENLRELETRRAFGRERRKKDGVLTAAIVGYTNVGKSTLLNKLTEAGVLTEDKLFATLDLTSRGILLPDGRNLILVDTVGLIRRLPHHLVEAFKSTLEEAKSADIILHICDISDPEVSDKVKTAEEILASLGCGGIPTVNILNKCDKVENDIRDSNNVVKISAKTGEGIERMMEVIQINLPETAKVMKLKIPYDKGGFIAKIREGGTVYDENYIEDGIVVNALVDIKLINEALGYVTDI